MPDKNPMPATDSARDLRNLVHDDVTADFEDDPKFADSNPSANASSENLVMRDTDDDDDSDDELEEEDDEEYEDDEEDDDEDDVDVADEDDEADDEDDEDEFDDEDEEEEDDEDEVSASRFVLKRAA